MTTYEVVYGKNPLSVTSYLLGTSEVQAMDHKLHTRETILNILKNNLAMDKNRMKKQAYQHHFKCSFITRDKVFLLLQPYKQTSLKDKTPQELAPKFYQPYEVI
jgi:hypothetical protein